MSMRTIVEFNHDYAHRIVEEPAEFASLLNLAMAGSNDRFWEKLERFGVRKAVMVHHSDERKVVTKFKEYIL